MYTCAPVHLCVRLPGNRDFEDQYRSTEDDVFGGGGLTGLTGGDDCSDGSGGGGSTRLTLSGQPMVQLTRLAKVNL